MNYENTPQQIQLCTQYSLVIKTYFRKPAYTYSKNPVVLFCVKRSLRKHIWSYSLRHIGHTHTNNGFFKLVEALLQIHLCFLPL